MRPLLFAISVFMAVPALASLYTPDKPDCSKPKEYVDNLQKNGFKPLFTFMDAFLPNTIYVMYYNPLKQVEVIVSNRDDKVCLVATGINTNFGKGNPDTLRKFLDNAFTRQETLQ